MLTTFKHDGDGWINDSAEGEAAGVTQHDTSGGRYQPCYAGLDRRILARMV
jgi:hypothetical protein